MDHDEVSDPLATTVFASEPDAAALPDFSAHANPPLTLIDPKLQARALKRLQGMVNGNGVAVQDVSIESCEAQVYPFAARTAVRLVPQYGVRVEPGLNRQGELCPTPDDFNQALQTAVTQARTEPPRRQSIIDFLFKRPDKGFGMKAQKVRFHALKRDFVLHEGCVTCAKLGKIKCSRCAASGQLNCPLCHTRRQITCPQCRGSGHMTSAGKQHSCTRCHGDGKIPCHQCQAKGTVPCSGCATTGAQKCTKCAGSGWLSHLAHMDMEAQIQFDFERDRVPPDIVRMVDAFGSRLVEKNDIEVVLAPLPLDQEQIALSGEPDDTIHINYDAKAPYGPIHFRIRDKVVPATLFGYHGKLIEAPSFLTELTQKGRDVLAEAASGQGDVADKIRRAAKYRLLCDVIIQAAGKARQKQSLEILVNRYPTGIDKADFVALLNLSRQALTAIIFKPSLYGLVIGLVVYAALTGLYFAGPGRETIHALGVPESAVTGLDFLLPALGLISGAIGAQIAAAIAQRKALSGAVAPDIIRKLLPRLGRMVWWSGAGALTIWTATLVIVIMQQNTAAPLWAQSFYELLK